LVGVFVGYLVALLTGGGVGFLVGTFVGKRVGALVGFLVGFLVGLLVGDGIGDGPLPWQVPELQVPKPPPEVVHVAPSGNRLMGCLDELSTTPLSSEQELPVLHFILQDVDSWTPHSV
jgi:hypothetical protein